MIEPLHGGEVKSKKLAAAVLALGFLAGCSSMTVNHDWAREADFSKYKTFQYVQTEANIADSNPLGDQRIVAGIKREMTAKGFTEASSNPDVFVTYHGEDQEGMSFDTMHTGFGGYGYGPGWRWGYGGMGMGSSTTTVRTYTKGTLIVDIWDASAKELIWRGVASDTLSDNPQKNVEKANKALAKMFERYPPQAGS